MVDVMLGCLLVDGVATKVRTITLDGSQERSESIMYAVGSVQQSPTQALQRERLSDPYRSGIKPIQFLYLPSEGNVTNEMIRSLVQIDVGVHRFLPFCGGELSKFGRGGFIRRLAFAASSRVLIASAFVALQYQQVYDSFCLVRKWGRRDTVQRRTEQEYYAFVR